MSFSIVHSCHNLHGFHQLRLSVGLRSAGVVFGIFVASIGILVLSHAPILCQLGRTAGCSMLTAGLFSILLGLAIQCVQKTGLKGVENSLENEKGFKFIVANATSHLHLVGEHRNTLRSFPVQEKKKRRVLFNKPFEIKTLKLPALPSQINIRSGRIFCTSSEKRYAIVNPFDQHQSAPQFEEVEEELEKGRTHYLIQSTKNGEEIHAYDDQTLSKTVTVERGGKVTALAHTPNFLAYSFFSPIFQNCVRILNLATKEPSLYTSFKEIFFYEDKFLGLNAYDDWELYSLEGGKLETISSIFDANEKIVKIIIKDDHVIFLHKDPNSFLNVTLFSLIDLNVVKEVKLSKLSETFCDMHYENKKLLICATHGLKLKTWLFIAE